MTGELMAYCSRYYKLTQLLARREARLQTVLANAPLYSGQTNLAEIDAIISYYRNAQALKAKADETLYDLTATGRTILTILQHFGIPPGTILNGHIPGELEYQLCADENDQLHITKTRDLAPLEDDPDIMVIKMWDGVDSGEEEE